MMSDEEPYNLFQVRKSPGKVLPVKYRLHMASGIGFTNKQSTEHTDTIIHNIPLTSYTEKTEVHSEITAKLRAAI